MAAIRSVAMRAASLRPQASKDHGLIDCATCATFNVNCDNVNGRSSSAQQLQVAGARGACISMPSGDEAAVARPFGICRAPARFIASRTSALRAAYDSEAVGASESMEFRVFFKDGGKRVSPWHDIPLKNGDGSFNFICEIPKESDAKMEVATDETANPIKQDTKKGKLRFYPYNINWNYGMLPQTWEDPGHKNEELDGVFGDNDPVDVVEIGSAALPMGSVHNVKVLGVYAMIDDGELDWKVIAINTNDPKASSVNDVEDVEREFPGELEKIMIWFRDYKMPDGKPANSYGYDNQCMNREFALKVIEETNGFYLKLKSGERVNDEELSLA